MDVCSWDWGAIAGFTGAGATIIAAIVAWNISEKWRDQKGDEILSNEAKNLILILEEYSDKLEKMHSLIMDPDSNFYHDNEITELKETAYKLGNRSILFSELIENEKELVITIKKLAVKFYHEASNLDKLDLQEIIQSKTSRTLVSRFNNEIKASREFLIKCFKYEK